MTDYARLALFDLDGTLVDSAPDIAFAVDQALTGNGYDALGETRVRDFIGGGAERLVHRAICNDHDRVAPADRFAPVFALFLEAYAAQVFERSRVYPGALTMLDTLQADGWRLGLITNKPARFTHAVVDAAGLAGYFDIILSGDSLARKKPHPSPLLHAQTQLATAAERSVMVGDSLIDLEAARAAQTLFIAVDYGYAGGVDLAASGATRIVSTLAELPTLLASLLPAAPSPGTDDVR